MRVVTRSTTIKRFQKDNFQDDNLESVQTNTELLWNDLRSHPLLKGRLVENIQFNAAGSFEYQLAHKLNRMPKGYIVVRNNSNFPVYDAGIDKKFIYLLADGTATITIWVF